MSAYPIWNRVTACIYKNGENGAKSYGVKETGNVEVVIGTSARNSHPFVNHRVTHRLHANGDRSYHFYLDDVLVKRAELIAGTDQPVYWSGEEAQARAQEFGNDRSSAMNRYLTIEHYTGEVFCLTETDDFESAVNDENAADWIWQFADSPAQAIEQHPRKVDLWQADVSAGRRERRTY